MDCNEAERLKEEMYQKIQIIVNEYSKKLDLGRNQ